MRFYKHLVCSDTNLLLSNFSVHYTYTFFENTAVILCGIYQTFVIFAKWNATCFRVRFVFIMQRSTECGILHFSVSWYYLCRYDLRSAHTYVHLSTYTYISISTRSHVHYFSYYFYFVALHIYIQFTYEYVLLIRWLYFFYSAE